MEEAGFRFEVAAPEADESFRREDFAGAPDVALALARRKAAAAARRFPSAFVLGADTLVESDEGEILGRPADRSESRRMIERLAGRMHRVHTGVAIRRGDAEESGVDTAEVIFRPLSAEEIEEYVETGEGDDKAGAYGYQERGGAMVERVVGDPQTVIGLPVRLVCALLARCGWIAGPLAALLLFMPRVHAAGWTEYRRVAPIAGVPMTVMLEDSPVLLRGDTPIVVSWSDPALVLVAPDTRERRLLFQRATLGPLELVIRPLPPRVAPEPVVAVPPAASMPPANPSAAPAPVLPPRSSIEPVIAAPRSSAPPIVAPPPPLVLSTLPASDVRPAASTVPRVAPEPEPAVASVAPVAAVEAGPARIEPAVEPTAGAYPNAPTATERAVPRGSTSRIDTSIMATAAAKPGELAIYSLASDLLARGLYGDAIDQFQRLLTEYPRTTLRDAAMTSIGQAYKKRAEQSAEEALRQRDLRRSGGAIEALDGAIRDYSSAVGMFRDVLKNASHSSHANMTQLAIAQSLHGLVSAQFQKGGTPSDSPAVVVEYLRAFVGSDDTSASPAARLGIARYYRDLGDARLLAKLDRTDIRQAYDRAVEEYRTVVATWPQSSSAEEALIDMARLFDRNLEMRKFGDAVRYYEEIVTRFPESAYVREARDRAKWIRENYL